jgi:hypothetical protein
MIPMSCGERNVLIGKLLWIELAFDAGFDGRYNQAISNRAVL